MHIMFRPCSSTILDPNEEQIENPKNSSIFQKKLVYEQKDLHIK